MLKLICPFIAVLVLIVLPLWLIARRAKAGKSVKKPLVANLCGFFLVMFATAAVFRRDASGRKSFKASPVH